MRKKDLEYLVKKYPKGTLIHINWMDCEPNYQGREGTVTSVDSDGQIHGTWGGCALLNEVDNFFIIKNK